MPRLAITGLGAVTSVGGDAPRAAAAIRAGVSRPAPLPLTVPDPDRGEDVPLLGHPAAGVADGFEGVALLSTLGSQALRGLRAGVAAGPEIWADAAVFVCASPYRSEGLSFVTDRIREALVDDLVRACGLPIPADGRFLLLEEHAGAFFALVEAARALEERRCARALVIAADSLVKEADLEWLAAEGRLKSPDDAAGLEPGEGAGAILVEREDEVRRRGARVLAWLEAVRTGKEPACRADGHRGEGRALADAIRGALGGRRTVGSVFVDLNGEDDRAFEWGVAVARLAATHELPAAPDTIATSIGDTGAASGALQLVCATQALARGYARGDACLVCSSADSGKVGAALLVAAGGAP